MAIPDPEILQHAFDEYPDVVERQGVSRLVDLDRWYRMELPDTIRRRDPPFVTREEMARLTEWKMARGVWRARNLALVRSNDPDSVRDAATEAFASMPHPTRPVSRLAKLKGVGPATASAALSAAAPETYPFFDELVAAQLPGLGPVKWTLGYYAAYADALRKQAGELGNSWTPARLEQALWSHSGGKAAAKG